MYYEKRFLHRVQEMFLVVGAGDYEELLDLGVQHNRYLEISMDALRCLIFFPNVEYLIVTSGEASPKNLGALNGLHIKQLKLDYYAYDIDAHTIDLSYFPVLELLFARTQYCFQNSSKCRNLQTLIVQEWLSNSLQSLAGSSIKALKIFSGKLRSMDGVGSLPQLVSLSIANQRQLVDCSGLAATCLESVEIVSCNKVEITQIPVLPNTRMMHLSGKKVLPNIHIILNMAPRLEWLLLDCPVADGELAALKNLAHAVIFTDCRHYSLKSCDLPKATENYRSYYLPTELEILPEAY